MAFEILARMFDLSLYIVYLMWFSYFDCMSFSMNLVRPDLSKSYHMFSEHAGQASKNWRIQNSLFEARKKRGKTFARFSVWDDDGEDRVELNHRYIVECNRR